MINSTRKFTLLLVVALLLCLSAKMLIAEGNLGIDSCWDKYYGLIYKGSNDGITAGLEFEVWRDGVKIGDFKIFGVEETSSKGIFKPINGNDVLKEGDLLKGTGGTEWVPAPKSEKKEDKPAKRSLKLTVDKNKDEDKSDDSAKKSEEAETGKEYPRRINPKEDKEDSSADNKSDNAVKKETKKEKKEEKKEEKKKEDNDKSKVITKPKEEKTSEKDQVAGKKIEKNKKQEKSGQKETARFGLKNSDNSEIPPAVASDDKAIAISQKEDKPAEKDAKKNEAEKLNSQQTEDKNEDKSADQKHRYGLKAKAEASEPATAEAKNEQTVPIQKETDGVDKTKNKFGLISELPEKKQSKAEENEIKREDKTEKADAGTVKEESKGGSTRFGLKTKGKTASSDKKEVAKTEHEKQDTAKKPVEEESPKGLPIKLSAEKEDNSNLSTEKKANKKTNESVQNKKPEKVEKVIPWTAQKHIYAADNYFYDRDYNLALEHYSAALTLDPKNEKAKNGIIDCSKKLGVAVEPKEKHEEAKKKEQKTYKAEDFGSTESSKLDGNSIADVENNYGVYLIQEKNYKEAIEWLNKAVADKPEEATYYRNRAVAYYKAGDITQAVYDAKTAYEKGDEKSKDLLLTLKKMLEESERKQPDGKEAEKPAAGK